MQKQTNIQENVYLNDIYVDFNGQYQMGKIPTLKPGIRLILIRLHVNVVHIKNKIKFQKNEKNLTLKLSADK